MNSSAIAIECILMFVFVTLFKIIICAYDFARVNPCVLFFKSWKCARQETWQWICMANIFEIMFHNGYCFTAHFLAFGDTTKVSFYWIIFKHAKAHRLLAVDGITFSQNICDTPIMHPWCAYHGLMKLMQKHALTITKHSWNTYSSENLCAQRWTFVGFSWEIL